ncbi:MAG: sigma-54-dependent Fis family transcriptional regulator [Gemmatimonadetes bacterium]|nr:sigma-54 dependent transcriptional regulator [Gemmatimonadota bacterium]MXX34346.1 sigma-54-dependent Fis family transcriptional regulator [Gemmatimonadota bacterium]MYD14695.1 sigma-54-dependent Fis family transcriptional regulator [Gemmatimonadota bacterium]MYI65311.1 sigma-54-dependent Fis family transcriptional regulator [Gemmatimonadota bacterium]
MTARSRRTPASGGLVLIIDDVRPLAEQYAYDIARLGGFNTRVAPGGAEGLDFLTREVADCVILDLEMPGLDGFDVLRAMEHREIDVPVIVYTGTGDFDRCVEAVRLGAFSFIDKSEPMERVVHEVRLALRQTDLRERLDELEERSQEESPLIGESAAMVRLRGEIARVADIPSPVLVLGESGTGKELVARELHRQSRRRDEAFVAVNCGGISEGLVDSDLFGHDRGAFTGAVKARRGAFERANSGTLFLDEIGELPGPVQARLLRVLEGGEMVRVGGEQPITVGARIVAATHRDLDAEAARGSFREDLLFRLNVHVIRVPPLRERGHDIDLLARHFAVSLATHLGRPARPVTETALAELRARGWERNNVRELRNTVERMIIASDAPVLDLGHVPADLGSGTPVPADPPANSTGWPAGLPLPADTADASFQDQKRAAERAIVLRALDGNDWKIGRTARALGLADHSSLIKIMNRLEIRRADG